MTGWSEVELRNAVSGALCYADVLRTLNIVLSGATQGFIKEKITKLGIDTSHFDLKLVRSRNVAALKLRKLQDVFVENSQASPSTVRRLLKSLIPYVCILCGNNGIHNGKPLKLQLDHENGVRNDNRRINLRWLCPNCHSQTPTYSRVKHSVPSMRATVKLECSHCGETFSRQPGRKRYTDASGQQKHYCKPACSAEAQKSRRVVDRKLVCQLYSELGSKNAVAKHFNVGYPTISKILKQSRDGLP